jgi:hypothetical protein
MLFDQTGEINRLDLLNSRRLSVFLAYAPR